MEDWLTYIGLSKYIKTFIDNGYDDLNFIGEDIISGKQDLIDIGIMDEKDITHLLESLKKKGNCAGTNFPHNEHGFKYVTNVEIANESYYNDGLFSIFQYLKKQQNQFGQKVLMNGWNYCI